MSNTTKTSDGAGSDVIDPNNITDLLNDEDSDLSLLSHVDDPNDVWYIICGVIIAMLSVGVIIILVAVTISKLRKREESSHINNASESTQQQQIVSTVEPVFRQSPTNVWHFPPLPPQPNLYIYNASSQDALVHSSNEKLGLRGFRKQLSGRFKRLVSRKSHEPTPVIPPELKPQLKTIYVY
ncbi:hypothetical protein PVAND_000607 [Polypedilum vanderplanki]|uniref:Uncharacterized protein n=1 Tax=Polypedilum vanderplanki TaxID=319348 RepID=A0A9J6BKG4_POLVA|nr:hypothetical protein PVAND_000607 [Polypedilum vanderplanki]